MGWSTLQKKPLPLCDSYPQSAAMRRKERLMWRQGDLKLVCLLSPPQHPPDPARPLPLSPSSHSLRMRRRHTSPDRSTPQGDSETGRFSDEMKVFRWSQTFHQHM
ncbi:hypothetical protein CEXT_559751 [Caerostris extrusa]|uniref:Uncharacterized protein n=1 Tax=Caerostris extrusa TaxID=172846 RepID=A0AAV4QFS3_CAEEX|nr:hypothetical protein CEXT_559751 [Caerostris extrusa]